MYGFDFGRYGFDFDWYDCVILAKMAGMAKFLSAALIQQSAKLAGSYCGAGVQCIALHARTHACMYVCMSFHPIEQSTDNL